MLTQSQSLAAPSARPLSGELSAADLLGRLEEHPVLPLIFSYEGHDVLPGYHVTEVKNGSFQALDCGANYESWQETFIQLWDIPPDDNRGYMRVAKFLAIIGKVAKSIAIDQRAKLTFEVSDGQRAMQLYRASSVEIEAGAVRVALTRRPASCKPRDRWLEQENATQTSSCAPTAKASSCCGTSQ